MQIITELYAIPHQTDYILYAPLKRMALLVNKNAIHFLGLLKSGKASASAETKDFIETLKNIGFIDDANDETENIPEDSFSNDFRPTDVTLFPTYDCNLRCNYCYAMGGDNLKDMTWDVAKAAIDFVCQNAIERNTKSFNVNFHGGGEPTRNWNVFTKSVEYAQELAKSYGLKTSSSTATNCILNQTQQDWIVSNLQSAVVSLDGYADIQNKQRPLVNMGSSYHIVESSLKYFDESKFHYTIRSTITKDSVKSMSEILSFFCENFSTHNYHFEPVFECGRCLTTKTSAPDWKIFLVEFLRAQKTAEKHQVNLHYSGARIDTITSSFCGAVGRNFVVLPTGDVTSCFEVCRTTDKRAEKFFYGSYNFTTRSFEFDKNRLNYLAKRNVKNMPNCSNCFAKWHCAGDCPAKSANLDNDIFSQSPRCALNQELTKSEITTLLFNQKLQSNLGLKAEILSY